MRGTADLLYCIFEQHLFSALVEEETTTDFVQRVVSDYIVRLSDRGTIPREHRDSIETDLREEVLEMLRKKTYGHFNLAEFRRAHAQNSEKAPEKEMARRNRRTC